MTNHGASVVSDCLCTLANLCVYTQSMTGFACLSVIVISLDSFSGLIGVLTIPKFPLPSSQYLAEILLFWSK